MQAAFFQLWEQDSCNRGIPSLAVLRRAAAELDTLREPQLQADGSHDTSGDALFKSLAPVRAARERMRPIVVKALGANVVYWWIKAQLILTMFNALSFNVRLTDAEGQYIKQRLSGARVWRSRGCGLSPSTTGVNLPLHHSIDSLKDFIGGCEIFAVARPANAAKLRKEFAVRDSRRDRGVLAYCNVKQCTFKDAAHWRLSWILYQLGTEKEQKPSVRRSQWLAAMVDELERCVENVRLALAHMLMGRLVQRHLRAIKARLWRPEGRLVQCRSEAVEVETAVEA